MAANEPNKMHISSVARGPNTSVWSVGLSNVHSQRKPVPAAMLTGLSAAPPHPPEGSAAASQVAALRTELEDTRGKLALAEVRIDRLIAVAKYSGIY